MQAPTHADAGLSNDECPVTSGAGWVEQAAESGVADTKETDAAARERRRLDNVPSMEVLARYPQRVLADDLPEIGSIPFAMVAAQTPMPFCLADRTQPDCPLVFANSAFLELTGYAIHEVIGRNCRFLQGPDTDPHAVAEIRAAIEEPRAIAIDLLNYRKNGSSFWNAMHIAPVFDGDGAPRYVFATQWDVSSMRHVRGRVEQERTIARELKRRMNFGFAIVMHTIRSVGRAFDAPTESREINERVLAMTRGFETGLAADRLPGLSAVDAIERIMSIYDRWSGRLRVEGDPDIMLGTNRLGLAALVLHELATREPVHDPETRLVIRVLEERNGTTVHWLETGGAARTPQARSRGERVVDDIVTAAGGRLAMGPAEQGFAATLFLRRWEGG